MLISLRNQSALTDRQILFCQYAWANLGNVCPLVISEAPKPGSQTRFNEDKRIVLLGANAFPGGGLDGLTRMSVLACLAHEKAHFERFMMGYDRPTNIPELYLDEAETHIHAAFDVVLAYDDRMALAEAARNQMNAYIEIKTSEELK